MHICLLVSLGLLVCAAGPGLAQESEDGAARAREVVEEVVRARGGNAYLNVRTLMSRGQYTSFDKGKSGLPTPFVDYIEYPDRERTEFGKGDTKSIQSNSPEDNWVYDGQQKAIREQTDEQVKSFLQSFRFDLDNVLKRAASGEGVRLVYIGRREVWKNTFSEAVQVDYEDGGSVTLFVDLRSRLPLMTEYKLVEGETATTNQTRFFRWAEYGGVRFATLQDFYRGGQQTGRASFDFVKMNEVFSQKLFAKPVDIKEVK